MVTTLNEQLRKFSGNAATDLDHPVDTFGRVRWATVLDRSAITRAAGDEPIGFKGHAAMFNSRTWIGGSRWGFWEQIASGAFAKTITEADIRFLINHDPNLVLARNKAGHLRLTEDDLGLSVDADMAPTTYSQDLAISLERGDITQMSFAFEPLAWRTEEASDGEQLITLTELRLFDVAVVTYPAYTDTDASLRSAAFAAIAAELDTDPTALLRQFADGKPLGELIDRPASRNDSTGAPEHGEPPADGTRNDNQPVPATGDPTETQRALDRRMSMMRTKQIKEI